MPRDRYDDDDDRPRRRRDDEDDDRPRGRRDDDEDDDRPRRRSRRDVDFDRPPPPAGNGMAVASLVLGLLSFCLGPLTGLIGGILGLVALRKPTGRGLAITGLVLSFVCSVGYVIGGVFFYLEGQKLRKESNNLKQLGLAAHNYESAYGTLPQPQFDPLGGRGGEPNQDLTSKLSWRVALLPYIEQENVFRQFKIDEPWDSGTNRPLADKLIQQYADVESPTDPTTRWRCFYGPQTMFPLGRGMSIIGATDGTSNTIMFVEGGDKVRWSRFQEYKYDPNGPLPPLGKPSKPTFMVVMGDGSVRNIRKNMNEQMKRAMITANGGEVVEFDGK
jgi:hypothetical protein